METLGDEVQYLRRCIRDLIAFTTLPAVWTGREPQAIAESLAEVLLHTLRLDIVYVRVRGSSDEITLEAARAAQQPEVGDQAQAIGRALAPWLTAAKSDSFLSIPNPVGNGTVRLTVIPIGYEGGYGMVAAGSQQSDFPTELDRLLLNVGANQVAVWLKEARLLAALRVSEERLRAIFNQVTIGVAQTDLVGRFEGVNQRYCDILGRPMDEVLRLRMQDVTHLEDLPHYLALFERLATTGQDFVIEKRYVRPDGSSVWVQNSVSRVTNRDGSPRCAVAVVQDITARKQAEKDRALLAFIVESSEDAIISKSLDGVVTSWNAAAERLFGYRSEEMIGQPILLLLPEDRQDEERLILERLRRGERMDHFETVRRTKDGRLLDVSITISPLHDERGTIIGASKIAHDITARKQMEGELAQQAVELQRVNNELQQFSHIVSHDLNEPLRTMNNFAQLLARRYQGKLDATAEEYISFITDAAQRMQQMITDLLAYTRIGGPTAAFIAVDGETLLARVLTDLQLAIADAKAEVTHDPLPTVQGDETRLGQVFQNLIGNALKFCKEAPRIHITAQRDGQHWRFAVRDNGIGIDPAQVKRLFQVFQRLHTRGEYPGTGIGLAICKKIVERHGGRIWVESQPGKGATFYFTIRENSSQ